MTLLVHEGETTDLALLDRLGDWADHRAWVAFVRCYDPLIRRYCRAYRFDPETMEELCQRIWIDLARRLRTYRYDPGQRFRAWLGFLCRSRAVDLYRLRRAQAVRPLDPALAEALAAPITLEANETPDRARPDLLLRAEQIQEAVRRRIDARTWHIFWCVAVENGTVREAADAAGISYAAAFAAQKRVRRMLREEAARTDPEAGS